MIQKIKYKISQDKHFSELLKGSSIAFLFKILGIFFSYILTLIIAKWYGAETMGLYTTSLTLLNIAVVFGVFGLDQALVKFIAKYNSINKNYLIKEVYKKALFISFPLALFIFFIFFFNIEYFAIYVFKNEHLIIFFKIISFAIVPFIFFKINISIFKGLKKIQLFSFFQFISIFLSTITILLISHFYFNKQEIVIISQVISIFIVSIISYIILKKFFINKKNKYQLFEYKELLNVSFPLLLTSSMSLFMGWTDIIMLGIFQTEQEVGIYSVLVKLAGLTSVSLMAINTIATPKFSELYSKNDIKGLSRVARSSTKIIFYTTLPSIIILSLFPSFILGIFGKEFIIGVTALWILMFGQFINAISGSVGNILNMTDNQNIHKNIIFISILINIFLNFLLIQKYGIVGASIATSISIVIRNLLSVFFVYKKLKINIWN